MTVFASDIIRDARVLLIDPLGTRWLDAELIDWINDATKQVVLLKPDSNPSTSTFTCAAGAKQTLPAGTVALFDVVANIGVDESAITFVKRPTLDAEQPAWRNMTQASVINYYMYDEWQRDVFYVYPPAVVSTTIEIITADEPAELTQLTDPIPLQDIYAPAITNYVIWRAFSKDSDFSGDPELATRYYASFIQALAGKTAAEDAEAPQRNLPDNIRPR